MATKKREYVSVDVSQFQDALKHFQKLTNKDDKAVISGAAIDAAFKSIAPTKTTRKGLIERYNPVQSDWSTIPYGKKRGAEPRMLYATYAKRGQRLSQQEAIGIFEKRSRSRGWMRAHWLAVAKVLVEEARKNGIKKPPIRSKLPKPLMEAARKFVMGEMKLRRTVKKSARFDVDLESSAEDMMRRARDKGLARAASSMVTNAHRKYVQNARKVSARR